MTKYNLLEKYQTDSKNVWKLTEAIATWLYFFFSLLNLSVKLLLQSIWTGYISKHPPQI